MSSTGGVSGKRRRPTVEAPRRKTRARARGSSRKRSPRRAKASASASGAAAEAAAANLAGAALSSVTLLGKALAGLARGGAWLGRHGLRLTWSGLQDRRVQRVLAGALLAAGLCGASTVVRARVQRWERFAISNDLGGGGKLPPGLSSRVREDLARLPLPEGAHAFDGRLPRFVHAYLRGLPWVAEVEDVRLAPPRRLSFSLRARRPVAQLGGAANAPLVTQDGAVIPRAYGECADLLPRLRGVPAANRPLRRQRALRAGIAVLDALAELPRHVVEVDLANLGGRRDPRQSEVLLRLAGDLLVEWGRAEPPPPAGLIAARASLAPAAKRAALASFLEEFPRLDQVERVSLRWDETTFVLRPPPALADGEGLAQRSGR